MNSNNLSPEDEHGYLTWQKSQRRGKVVAGILVVTFGIIYLLDVSGFQIPHWVYTPPTFLVALGFIVLVKHKFKTFIGWASVIIGKMLLLNEFYPDFFNTDLIWPVIIILFGLKIIFKPKNNCKQKKWDKIKKYSSQNFSELDAVSDNDFIETTAIFGGVKRNIVSKNFKGANITNIFGGSEIDLLQADFENQVFINLENIFGGVSIIVPPHWQVKSELVTVFGGIEDKRQMSQNSDVEHKVLILKGNCVFGGIEIKSFK
jgi:predicted membrane protein